VGGDAGCPVQVQFGRAKDAVRTARRPLRTSKTAQLLSQRHWDAPDVMRALIAAQGIRAIKLAALTYLRKCSRIGT
jgi:hypothetical protein